MIQLDEGVPDRQWAHAGADDEDCEDCYEKATNGVEDVAAAEVVRTVEVAAGVVVEAAGVLVGSNEYMSGHVQEGGRR